MNKGSLTILSAAICAGFGFSSHALAQSTTWTNSGTGSWDNPGFWNNGLPDSSTNYTITNSGTAVVGVGVSGTGRDLSVGLTSGASGALLIEGGALTNRISSFAAVAGSQNSAVVSSGTWRNLLDLNVGVLGSATLDLSGGLVSSATVFRAGASVGSQGIVTITGGTLSTKDSAIGQGGVGVMNLAGGTILNNNVEYLGYDPQGKGTLNLTSGTYKGKTFNAGWSGTGTLNISGGRMEISGTTIIATNATGVGSILVSGTAGNRGVLASGQIAKGAGSATLRIDGGQLVATRNESDFLSGFLPGEVKLEVGGAFIDSGIFAIGISTALSGTGGLTKLGQGTLTLSGNSSYTGGTTVSAGTLLVTGDNSAAGGVTVESGGVLGGRGVVSDALIKSGGKLAIGVATGTMTVAGDLILENGSTLTMKLSGTSAGLFDQIAIGDEFTAGGLLFLDVGYVPVIGDSFTIFTDGAEGRGWTSGGFTIGTDLGGGLAWATSDLATEGVITVVPEPATTALVLGAGAIFLARRRRRASCEVSSLA